MVRIGKLFNNGEVIGLRVQADTVGDYSKCLETLMNLNYKYCEYGFLRYHTFSRVGEVAVFDFKLDSASIPMRLENGVYEQCEFKDTANYIELGLDTVRA